MTSSSSSVVPTAATQALPCSAAALRPAGTVLPGMRTCSADDQRHHRQPEVGEHQAVDELARFGGVFLDVDQQHGEQRRGEHHRRRRVHPPAGRDFDAQAERRFEVLEAAEDDVERREAERGPAAEQPEHQRRHHQRFSAQDSDLNRVHRIPEGSASLPLCRGSDLPFKRENASDQLIAYRNNESRVGASEFRQGHASGRSTESDGVRRFVTARRYGVSVKVCTVLPGSNGVGVPSTQARCWSPKCGDSGWPLWPPGICRIPVSSCPGETTNRSDAPRRGVSTRGT